VLAIEYALKHPQQLKGIILSNVTASIESYLSHLNQLRAALPQPLQDRLRFHEERQDFHNPEYERILFEQIRSHYLCRLSPWPEPLLRTFAHQNHQVSQTIYGPTTYLITGNFRNWNRWNDLHKISVPTLVICGRYDTMDPHDAERMGALIPRSQVKICENGSHCTLYDDPDTYFRALHAFISTVEERVINPDDAVPAR
jgi:proline iminopeptidase